MRCVDCDYQADNTIHHHLHHCGVHGLYHRVVVISKSEKDVSRNGKFKSHDFGRVLLTLIKVFSLIVLVHLIDTYILPDISFRLANIVAGAICFWQVWSMLENESSCNNAKWAKIAQRIMVDKTERHFDIDLHELKDDDSGGGAACETSKFPPKDNKPKTEEADGEG